MKLYLYGVIEGVHQQALEIKGIGGNPVFTVPCAEISAVVQECKEPYSAEDTQLMTEWILVHQAVIDLAWEKFETVIPFSFDTIIIAKDGRSAMENLQEWLVKESTSLQEKLKTLKGKAEYGVQISWDPQLVAPRIIKNDAEIQRLQEETCQKSPGTAYLLKQKLENLLRLRLEIAADVYFKECYQKIRASVEALQVGKTRKEEPPRQMLANFSCLASKVDIAKLGKELEKITQIEGLFVRFTGPWPPYSFVS